MIPGASRRGFRLFREALVVHEAHEQRAPLPHCSTSSTVRVPDAVAKSASLLRGFSTTRTWSQPTPKVAVGDPPRPLRGDLDGPADAVTTTKSFARGPAFS